MIKELLGELIGTFIIVLIGCGTVAVAVLFGQLNLYGVALLFGGGVALAIYTVMRICPAHLNPAVSIAMVFNGSLIPFKLPFYLLFQFAGAMLGAALLLIIFNDSIILFELSNGIERGTLASYHSAQMFGEFFPNPGFEKEIQVTHVSAIFYEALGTFLLMTVILYLPKIHAILKLPNHLIVGLTVTILIVFIAPYTQGGFNPARDFGPRLVAFFGGWGDAAYPIEKFSFFTVYILGPIMGSSVAVLLKKVLNKL